MSLQHESAIGGARGSKYNVQLFSTIHPRCSISSRCLQVSALWTEIPKLCNLSSNAWEKPSGYQTMYVLCQYLKADWGHYNYLAQLYFLGTWLLLEAGYPRGPKGIADLKQSLLFMLYDTIQARWWHPWKRKIMMRPQSIGSIQRYSLNFDSSYISLWLYCCVIQDITEADLILW